MRSSLALLAAAVLPAAAFAGNAQVTQQMIEGRNNHGAMLLTDGRVLVVGGLLTGGAKTASAEIFDPDTGTWTPVAGMPDAKARFSVVHLLDGRVAVIGGNDASSRLNTVAAYDPVTGSWASLAPMADERRSHASTRLQDGRVLAAGGSGSGGTRAEILEPWEGEAGTWRAAGTIPEHHQGHSQVLLGDGTVLIVGGSPIETAGIAVQRFTPQAPGVDPAGTWQSLAALEHARHDLAAIRLRSGPVLLGDGAGDRRGEIYDGSGSGATRTTGMIGERRRRAASVLLPDGRVFIAAGTNLESGGGRLRTTEVYDPEQETYAPGPDLAFEHDRLVAVLLADGRVLTAGGYYNDGSGMISLRSAQIVNPVEDDWWAGTPLIEARHALAAVLRPDGLMFAIGGIGGGDLPLSSVETLDTGESWPDWVAGPDLFEARARAAALVLADESVLVAGGEGAGGPLETVERLFFGDGAWTQASPMSLPRTRHRAVLLSSGEVLVIGGHDGTGAPTATAERFDPLTGAWKPAASMAQARARHTATLLADGRVLVAGGEGLADGGLASAEVYDPWNDVWTPAGDLPSARWDHEAVLLPRGRVLVSGGEGAGGALGDSALFEPATGAWLVSPSPITRRRHHVLEVLPGGRVLAAHGQPDGLTATQTYDPASRTSPTGPDTGVWIAARQPSTLRDEAAVVVGPTGWTHVIGGRSTSGSPLASTVLFVEGRAYAHWSWRPLIASLPSSVQPGEDLVVSGSNFTPTLEGSFGGHMATPVNHPVFTLRRSGGGGTVRPLARSFDDTSAILALPETEMLSGWWWMSPSVLGVLGRARAVFVRRAERLWFDDPPADLLVGDCYGPFDVHLVDPLGEPIARTVGTPLTASASDGRVTFHTDSGCSSPTTTGYIDAGGTVATGYVRAESAGEAVMRLAAPGLVAAEARVVIREDEPVDPDPPEGAPEIVRDANTVAAVGHPYLYGPDRRARADGELPIMWRVIEGPPGYVIDAPTGEVTWTPDASGAFGITLEAANDHGVDVYPHTVDVVADPPNPPAPVIHVTPDGGPAPLSVVLDGSESEAANGSEILTWLWELGDGSGQRTGPVVSHTYVQPRGHLVRLTVHDRYGVAASETAQVVVTQDGILPPSARIVASDIHSDGSLTTDLSCACFAGSDPIVAYSWELGDGTVSRESEVRHTYGPGSYEVVLTVVDAGGLEAVDRITLTISDGGNYPPVLVAQANPVAGEAPLEVTYAASYADPAGGLLEPAWTFDDGVVLVGDAVSRRYDEPGTHRVTVSVEGATGLRASRILEVTALGAEGLARPQIVSLPRTDAAVGEPYLYDETGQPLARGSRPLVWSLGKRVGEAVVGAPDGMTVDPATGALEWVPAGDASEVYVVLVAENDVGSAVQGWTVRVDGVEDDPGPSCDCAAGGGRGASALGLLAMVWCFRRRRLNAR